MKISLAQHFQSPDGTLIVGIEAKRLAVHEYGQFYFASFGQGLTITVKYIKAGGEQEGVESESFERLLQMIIEGSRQEIITQPEPFFASCRIAVDCGRSS